MSRLQGAMRLRLYEVCNGAGGEGGCDGGGGSCENDDVGGNHILVAMKMSPWQFVILCFLSKRRNTND